MLKSINNDLFLLNFVEDRFCYYNFKTKNAGSLSDYILSSTNTDLITLKNMLKSINYTSASELMNITKQEQKIQQIYYESENYFDDFENIKRYKNKMTFPLKSKNGVVGLAFLNNKKVTFQKGSKSGVWFDGSFSKSSKVIISESFSSFNPDTLDSFIVILAPFTKSKISFTKEVLKEYKGEIVFSEKNSILEKSLINKQK